MSWMDPGIKSVWIPTGPDWPPCQWVPLGISCIGPQSQLPEEALASLDPPHVQ